MLIVSRKKNETMVLGPNGEARVTVIDIRGDKVRLAFEVPREWILHRLEVYEIIQRENLGNDDDQSPS